MLNVSDIPEEGRKFFKTWGCGVGKNDAGGMVLQLHHPCQYLSPKGCTIYKKRPQFCREYKCKRLE